MSPVHPPDDATRSPEEQRLQRLRIEQVRLLYANATTGLLVTVLATLLLAGFQWSVIQHRVIIAWSLYMLFILVARLTLLRLYQRSSSSQSLRDRWGGPFAIGAGLAGAGWGAAGILLYPQGRLMNQVFLVFVLGGMMLGGASLLASRQESFLSFLLPIGLLSSLRLASEVDIEHWAMALLAAVFTAATIASTRRLYGTIQSSLNLQFDNHGLLQDLQIAKNQADLLNRQLESHVRERTTELHESNERLRSEIARREQMEEDLLRVRNLESLGVLAGGIAHDFNNFLTVIQGNIEFARMQLDPGAPVQASLQQTTEACERAAFLSSQLLTFAKGGTPIRRGVSVAKLVMDAVQLARTGSAVDIDVNIAGNVWPIEVDAVQIGQVLHNILLNARQAMPDGGIIEVRAQNVASDQGEEPDSGGRVRISIKDYGCGIPSENLHRIFDPYFTTKESSSGLGLATAYAIVKKHGGRLSVNSLPGQGATFAIDLPACREAPPAESPAGTQLRSGTGRLLVMDDEAALRKMLERVLTSLGYEVRSARDGAEVIALYEAAGSSQRGFDAVLLDVTVSGGMGGVEAAAKLRELNPSVKMIVSSGYSDAPVMSKYRDYGFVDVLPKPWTLPQLSEVFRRVLAGKTEHQPG